MPNGIFKLTDNCHLVVTAVDGSIDNHLVTYLQKNNIKYNNPADCFTKHGCKTIKQG